MKTSSFSQFEIISSNKVNRIIQAHSAEQWILSLLRERKNH